MIRSTKLLLILLFIALILNLSDALLTIYGLNSGLVEEINPIMEYLFDLNPLLFLVIKEILLFTLLIYIWLNQHRDRIAALSLASIIVITFVFINLWNINSFWKVGLING